MTRGKKVCKILKEIRQEIADKNDIDYLTSECHYKGECTGTCPKCEAELKYLENELHKRTQLGKAVAVAGISLGIAGTFSACNAPQESDMPISEQEIATEQVNIDTISMDTIPNKTKTTIETIVDGISVEDFDIESEDLTKDFSIAFTEGEVEKIDTICKFPRQNNDNDIMGIVEELPEYPGGEEARQKFIKENLIYPQEAKDKGIEGRVMVGFVVETDGSLTNIKILRGVSQVLDEEAIRITKLMPKWKGGKLRGVPTKVQYMMPVKFVLNDDEK